MSHRYEPPSNRWKFGIGIPSSRTIRVEFVKELDHWANGSSHDLMVEYDATAGRIDISRSHLMQWGVQNDVDALGQIDTDVTMVTPVDQLVRYLRESFREYDIVCAPSLGYDGRMMVGMLPGVKLTGLEPFEINGAAFGFVAMSRKLLRNLQPLTTITDISGRKDPLYGTSTDQTEDFSICINARKQGFRVCIDPRIEITHTKEIRLMAKFVDSPPFKPIPGIVTYIQKYDPPEEAVKNRAAELLKRSAGSPPAAPPPLPTKSEEPIQV